MKCKEVIKLLPDFNEGNLSPYVIDDIYNHLQTCVDCQLINNRLQSTLKYLKPTAKITEQPFYYTRLKQRMENKLEISENKIINLSIKKVLQPLAYAASLALAVYIGILIGSNASTQKQLTEVSTTEQDYIQQFVEYQNLNDFQLEKFENILIESNNTEE